MQALYSLSVQFDTRVPSPLPLGAPPVANAAGLRRQRQRVERQKEDRQTCRQQIETVWSMR